MTVEELLQDPAPALARAVAGQFTLERVVGRGGMGIVYLAHDEQLHRQVAIKTLPPHLAADAAVRDRFLREARTAASLSHPSIVPIYSAAEREGVVFFAMGYVEGESLAERIARVGPVPFDVLIPLLHQLASALGYAHTRGIVHRDVKAENVLLDERSGRAMVTDFGIARVTEAQPLTATGTILGTVQYMSPEQVIGEPLDGRSDLYALGVLAFYASTGRFPFERPSAPAVLVAHVNSAPPRLHEVLPDAPEAMDALIAKLLEKKRDDRFANAAELCEALEGMELDSAPGAMRQLVRADGAPLKLSDTEAQAVWSRAAMLQANTGMATPPAEPITPRTSPPTTGYDVDLVRASAQDAGIDARYVDRALAERDNAAAVVVNRGTATMEKNFFTGDRSRLEYEASVPGELNAAGFEEIADEVRQTLGEMVNVSSVGRTLTVTTASSGGGGRRSAPRQLQVTVTSRNGVTRVHALENLENVSGKTFGVGLGAIGAGGGGTIMGMIMGMTQNPAIAFGTWGVWMAAVYTGVRLRYRAIVKSRDAQLRDVVEQVAQSVRKYAK